MALFIDFVFGLDKLRVVVVALLGGALCLLIRYIWGEKGEKGEKGKRGEKEEEKKTFEEMGEIVPLTDLDWKTEQPERIYKFADKYNLTMGECLSTDVMPKVLTVQASGRQTSTRSHALTNNMPSASKERKRILAQYPGALGCLPAAEPMVRELYAYLVTHYLPRRYPTVFRLDAAAGSLVNGALGERLPLASPADIVETLRLLALVVDEDFLMLLPSPDGDGYSLQAFVWMYPVGFDPVDKMGMKLRDAHRPVPGYQQHLEKSMDRYFGRLTPGRVVERVNWAVATNASLCERGEYHLYADDAVSTQAAAEVDLDDTWVRCELQTLFALPGSGGRILSVHLYLYPLREIKQVGLAETMVRAIDGYGRGNVPAFARYKRTPVWGETVKAYLRGD